MAKIYSYINKSLEEHTITIEEAEKAVLAYRNSDLLAYHVLAQKLLNDALSMFVEESEDYSYRSGYVEGIKAMLEIPVRLQNQLKKASEKVNTEAKKIDKS